MQQTPTIHLLPAALASQIAAGEVVQRPASVVKELLENAIDAGAKNIKVIIKGAGKTYIQVIDDGIGMSEIDAVLSLEKHATSKIRHSEDLFNITTMGFRGEALPAIAAVSQLVIETRTQQAELGTRLTVEATTIKSQEPIATPQGTSITVKNLFFNVPARRNFLKSDAIETKHIIEEFQHIALASPDIAFSLYQNEHETYHLPATKLPQRIIQLLGEGYKKQLIPCQEHTDVLQIQGYIGSPDHTKKIRGEQYFFVNKRFVKSTYLHHAVKAAFEPLIAKDTFPSYVLFIDIAPQRVDVNVHPTKIEVKFDDDRLVYTLLKAAVQQALAHHGTSLLDFEQPTNQDFLALGQRPSSLGHSSAQDRHYMQFKAWDRPAPAPQDWQALLARIEPDKPLGQQTLLLEVPGASAAIQPEAHWMSADNAQPLLSTASNPSANPAELTAEKATKMQLQATYILASIKSGLLLIDQHAAHERILYEKYMQHLQHHTGVSQQLLFPEQVDLNQADAELLVTYQPLLTALGFTLESFGRNSLILVGYPAEVIQESPKKLFEAMLEQIKWNQKHLTLPLQENIARSLAKHAAIQPGKSLFLAEMDHLIDQLFACTYTTHTPDGRPIWTLLSMETLAKFLKT
jgi:DNA mismatch repair protein MutL